MVAVDLPGGRGKTLPMKDRHTDTGDFLLRLIKAVQFQRPSIVSPSMSGKYAVPLVLTHPEAFGAWIPGAARPGASYLSS